MKNLAQVTMFEVELTDEQKLNAICLNIGLAYSDGSITYLLSKEGNKYFWNTEYECWDIITN